MLDHLPEDMIIVGSGAIGSEFAWIYSTLGVKVTVVEYMPQLMPLEDEEVARAMERAFRKQRIGVMTSTTVKQVSVEDGRCKVEVEGKKGVETLSAEVVLSAVSRLSEIRSRLMSSTAHRLRGSTLLAILLLRLRWLTLHQQRLSAAWRRCSDSIPNLLTTR